MKAEMMLRPIRPTERNTSGTVLYIENAIAERIVTDRKFYIAPIPKPNLSDNSTWTVLIQTSRSNAAYTILRDLSQSSAGFVSSYRDALSEPNNDWALGVAEAMEQANIAWIDDPDASENYRKYIERDLIEKWERSQREDSDG